MVEPESAPGRFPFGWIFAAVWLFYLNENLSILLDHPHGWQRTVGLAALAMFAVGYLFVVSMSVSTASPRPSGNSPRWPCRTNGPGSPPTCTTSSATH